MFDIAPTELLLCAIVALLVIGPKDLPKAMRTVGYWVGRVRGMARHFRTGFDAMVREAELEEMEKKWAKENERIMREHPVQPEGPMEEGTAGQSAAPNASILPEPGSRPSMSGTAAGEDTPAPPTLTEKPEIKPEASSAGQLDFGLEPDAPGNDQEKAR